MKVSQEQRKRIIEQANNCCEYCLISQAQRLIRFQIDHVIARKHGGTDTEANLCLACYECNSYKGSNIASLDPLTGKITQLYHPRQQSWDEHFVLNDDSTISGKTPEGRVTVVLLRLNTEERTQQRKAEREMGDYPCK